jgi:hypothetical protein
LKGRFEGWGSIEARSGIYNLEEQRLGKPPSAEETSTATPPCHFIFGIIDPILSLELERRFDVRF